MDEILSSIRQIIADDDAGARRPAAPPAAAPRNFAPVPPRPTEPSHGDHEPLALRAEQIVRDAEIDIEAEDVPGISFDDLLAEESQPADLVDPDDVTFDTTPEPVLMPPPLPVPPRPIAPPPPPQPVSYGRPPAPPPSAPTYERPRAASVSQAAPLPDPRLTADIAEQLLEPAAQSVVQSAFTRLNNLSTVGANVTIEQMIREMLKPMLKEWLDENLPSVVERMVEQEIARVSRGGR